MIIKCNECSTQIQIRSQKLYCSRCRKLKFKYETYEFKSLLKNNEVKTFKQPLHMYI